MQQLYSAVCAVGNGILSCYKHFYSENIHGQARRPSWNYHLHSLCKRRFYRTENRTAAWKVWLGKYCPLGHFIFCWDRSLRL